MKKEETESPKHRPDTCQARSRAAPSQACVCHALACLGAHMQEPALGKADCHQLSHRGDTYPLTAWGARKTHGTESPPSSSREQAQQCLQPGQRKRSSFLGRKQGLVFVGFYASQENEAQGNNFLLLLTGFFYPFCPPAKQSPPERQDCQASLVKRHWYHHWRLIHLPILVLSGSFRDCQLNTPHI